MSYGTKYQLKFKDIVGKEYRVNIKQRTWTTTPLQLTPAENPALLNEYNASVRKMEPVKKRSLTINAVFNQETLGDTIRTDFQNMDDREWLVELKSIDPGEAFSGYGKIVTLNTDNISANAIGNVTVTAASTAGPLPTCRLWYEMLQFPSSTWYLTWYAVPIDEDANSTRRKKLVTVTLTTSEDTITKITDAIIAADSRFSRVNGSDTLLEFALDAADNDITAGWNVKGQITDKVPTDPTAEVYNVIYQTNDYAFTGDAKKPFFQIILYNQRQGEFAETIQLVRHDWISGETISDVVTDIVDQINGTSGYLQIDNVYFPSLSEYHDIAIQATNVGSGQINLIILKVGSAGNFLKWKDSSDNDTFLRVYTSANSSYTYTTSDPSGGGGLGDTFNFKVDHGSGYKLIAQVRAMPGESAADIISKLVVHINNSPFYIAEIDKTNDQQFNFQTIPDYPYISFTYRFTTSGSSVLFDGGPTPTTIDLERTLFMGWVIPNFLKTPNLPGNVPLTITAVDGLGDLSHFKFKDLEGLQLYLKSSYLEVITQILKKTGFNLKLYAGTPYWDNQMPNNITGLLPITYFDVEGYQDETLFTVLEELLFSQNCQLTQINGHWKIVPLPLLESNSYTEYIYNSNGRFLGTIDREKYQIDAGGSNYDNIMINASAQIQLIHPYKNVILTHKLGAKKQLTTEGDFANINAYLSELDTGYVWRWQEHGVDQNSYFGKLFRGYGVGSYLRICNSAGQTSQFYLTQYANVAEPSNLHGAYVIDMEIINTAWLQDAPKTLEIELKINDGSTILYGAIYESDPSSIRWQSAQTTIPIDIQSNPPSNVRYNGTFYYPRTVGYGTFGTEATVAFSIVQPTQGSVMIMKAAIALSFQLKEEQIYISNYGTPTSPGDIPLLQNLNSKDFERALLLGDVASVPGGVEYYKRGIFFRLDTVTFQPTKLWVQDPVTKINPEPLLQKVANYILKQYALPVPELSVEIQGDIRLEDLLIDKTDSDKLYQLIDGTLNIRMKELKGKYHLYSIDDSGIGGELYSSNTSGDLLKKDTSYLDVPFAALAPRQNYFKELLYTIAGDQIVGSTINITIPSDLEDRKALACVVFKDDDPLIAGTDYSYKRISSTKIIVTFITSIDTAATYYTRVF